ncbi:MAG TPA: DNA polymerase IV [Casimicrobiaceae bacterium]|nr:DNA polymerase IV [Casimicrobiaceae bacterium]
MPAAHNVVAHLDMDAFYASVELLRYPELRGKPVVIGGGRRHQPSETIDPATNAVIRTFATLEHYAGRGVITTATYEARALGLHSAMAMMKAAALAPQTILLPVDFDAYRDYSRRFKAAVRAIAPRIEDRGIDEIYIDLTDIVGSDGAGDIRAEGPTRGANCAPSGGSAAAEQQAWGDQHTARVRAVAQSIKDAVREATALSCSIGIARNKLLAKIASDLDKPDGLTLIGDGDLERRIWPLPARTINGIGPKTAARLATLGIRTIGELAHADPAFLVTTFGRAHGEWMHEAAHGRDDRPVVTHSEPQSISRETTFDRDLSARHDRDLLWSIFTELCDGVASDLARKGYVGRTIGIKLRFDDFRTVTRDRTIDDATQDAALIRRVAAECVKRVALTRRIRLFGVRVGGLLRADALAPVAREPEPSTANLFD